MCNCNPSGDHLLTHRRDGFARNFEQVVNMAVESQEEQGSGTVHEATAPEQYNALGRMLGSVMEVGRDILAKRGLLAPAGSTAPEKLMAECRELIHHRGEASGLALAGDIIETYGGLTAEERLDFFHSLASDFDVDRDTVIEAARQYEKSSEPENLWALNRVLEAPRQKLFRRINMTPGGTAALVAMRGELLKSLRRHPELKVVDVDMKHLFISWFNKGFLELRSLDWSSPAFELEKLIAYEAVHEINGWGDLRGRLREDRRCFAFFHPALAHDPLVFVEVALTDHIPESISPLLLQDRDTLPPEKADTVVFYSISNCHPGLAGVSFGNFLIKNVVQELKKDMPWLKTFVTLSPVPGFRKWLKDADLVELVGDEELARKVKAPIGRVVEVAVSEALMKLCAHYLVKEKSGDLARDPVARFHLGNGARLHKMNWGADLTAKGRDQSGGIMVNYLYDLSKIEQNHEAYFDQGVISVSRTISKLAD
jgi:malonyl-CoA decarboxylase